MKKAAATGQVRRPGATPAASPPLRASAPWPGAHAESRAAALAGAAPEVGGRDGGASPVAGRTPGTPRGSAGAPGARRASASPAVSAGAFGGLARGAGVGTGGRADPERGHPSGVPRAAPVAPRGVGGRAQLPTAHRRPSQSRLASRARRRPWSTAGLLPDRAELRRTSRGPAGAPPRPQALPSCAPDRHGDQARRLPHRGPDDRHRACAATLKVALGPAGPPRPREPPGSCGTPARRRDLGRTRSCGVPSGSAHRATRDPRRRGLRRREGGTGRA
jgi:hypothetical protein